MSDSTNMKRRQKISNESWPVEVVVETRGKQGVPSGSSASPDMKVKSEIDTERLLERIVNRRNLFEAYKRVKKNGGSPGIDGMTIEQLLPYLQEHSGELINSLMNGAYHPKPVRRVEIPKSDGGTRLLGIPTVVDRMIQQAVATVLGGVYEPTFSNYSYGFRPKRSAHMALKQSLGYINEGYRVVVDMDLEKFFDRVNHDILMARVAKRVKDKRVLKIIRRYLNSGIMINGIVVKDEYGTPQGGPLSPLLSNILLDDFDKELEMRGHKFVRYADDCNIYVRSKRAGVRVLKSITRFLEKELKLKVNSVKSAVAAPTKRKFLGYSFYYSKDGVKLRVHEKSYKRLKMKIRQVTNRNVSMNFDYRMKKLAEITTGWVNYFRLAGMKNRLKQLDKWIRRRIRACIWKTWKKIKTRFRALIKLGVSRHKAWEFANTRKGYWRTANSPILGCSITSDILERRGFKSLSKQYAKVRLS